MARRRSVLTSFLKSQLWRFFPEVFGNFLHPHYSAGWCNQVIVQATAAIVKSPENTYSFMTMVSFASLFGKVFDLL